CGLLIVHGCTCEELALGLLRHRRICSTLTRSNGQVAQLGSASLCGLSLQSSERLADLRSASLAALKLCRQVLWLLADTINPVLRCVGLLGSADQRLDLGLEPSFLLLHPLVAHCHVLARVRFHFGPVDRHMPELHKAG